LSKNRLEVIIKIVKNVGNFIRNSIIDKNNIYVKTSKNDLVTKTDRDAEKKIVKVIQNNFPEDVILGEEFSEFSEGKITNYENIKNLWIIDPIDGTTNFIHDLPYYCISIALMSNGVLKMGIIYDPINNECFVAQKGKGLRLNGKLVKVSNEESLSESILSTNIPRLTDGEMRISSVAMFTLHSKARGLRALGSTALQMAYVACGRLTGYWGYKLKPWDLAAATLMIEEAGGRVTDTGGNPYQLSTHSILGTNGLIHEDVIRILNQRS